jgi:hypothetical protein
VGVHYSIYSFIVSLMVRDDRYAALRYCTTLYTLFCFAPLALALIHVLIAALTVTLMVCEDRFATASEDTKGEDRYANSYSYDVRGSLRYYRMKIACYRRGNKG